MVPLTATLCAADYQAPSARRVAVIVAVQQALHDRVGDFIFPAPTSEPQALHSVLEHALKREGTAAYVSSYTRLDTPKQRGPRSLKQLGFVGKGGPGSRVYAADGPAASQKSYGKGPGGCTGLYYIDGRISRLTVREAARVQGFEDSIDFTDDERRARRQIGEAAPLGVMRAVGAEVGRYLAAAGEVSVGASRAQAPEAVVQQEKEARYVGSSAEEAKLARAMHCVRMVALQASDAALTAAELVAPMDTVYETVATLLQMPPLRRMELERAVKHLHWRAWLRRQRAAGHATVEAMRRRGQDEMGNDYHPDFLTAARRAVDEVMDSEEARGSDSDGPVRMLWWNWPADMHEDLIEGYRIPLDHPVALAGKGQSLSQGTFGLER